METFTLITNQLFRTFERYLLLSWCPCKRITEIKNKLKRVTSFHGNSFLNMADFKEIAFHRLIVKPWSKKSCFLLWRQTERVDAKDDFNLD